MGQSMDEDQSDSVAGHASLRSSQQRISVQQSVWQVKRKYTHLELMERDPAEGRTWSEKCVSQKRFRYLVFLVICLNMSVISVVEGIWDYEEVGQVTLTVERLALIFYILELAVRLHARQWRSRPWWILLDIVLVCVGVAALFIPPAICSNVCTSLQKHLLAVRLLRMLKLVQLSKEQRQFNAMWILFDGIVHAGPTILATTVFMLIVMAIFAGALNTVLLQDEELLTDPVLAPLVEEKFRSFPRALLSLVQFVSGDNISDLYFPLVFARPQLAFLFIPLLILVTVGLMSLIPVILFDGRSREKKRRQFEMKQEFDKVVQKMEKLF